MSITSVRLKPEVAKPLAELAQELDRSKSYLINEAVAEYLLNQNQEKTRWQDTIKALDSLEAGRTVDEHSAAEWLKSWGSTEEQKPPKA